MTDKMIVALVGLYVAIKRNENLIDKAIDDVLDGIDLVDACQLIVECKKKNVELERRRNELVFDLMLNMSCRKFDRLMRLAGSWYFNYGVNVT